MELEQVNYTDYDYDYDNCWNASFESVNDCLQVGEKINFSLRNDFLTFGYSRNEADYLTEDVAKRGTAKQKDNSYGY